MSDLNEMRQQLADVTAERDEALALMREARPASDEVCLDPELWCRVDAALNKPAEVQS